MQSRILLISFAYHLNTFFFCVAIGFEIQAQDADENILDWKERQLSYDDFRGPEDTTFLVYGKPAAAASALKVRVILKNDAERKITASITTIFNKSRSWIVVREAWVLNHEQGHFNIEEIFARRIRKAVQELQAAGAEDETKFKQRINDLFLEKSVYQRKYDDETTHGFHHSDQALWDERIKKRVGEF